MYDGPDQEKETNGRPRGKMENPTSSRGERKVNLFLSRIGWAKFITIFRLASYVVILSLVRSTETRVAFLKGAFWRNPTGIQPSHCLAEPRQRDSGSRPISLHPKVQQVRANRQLLSAKRQF